MKHPMQCAKCFRVCRLSDSGKTWVCTICKHREKANGGQAVSDTMCAKTTETSRCQRCGSEFDWLSDGTKVHVGKRYFESDSLLCLERQLNAANDRIKRLEDAGDKAILNSYLPDRISMWNKAKEDKL